MTMQDLRWQYIRAGKAKDYHGPAVHPRHLSLWEKVVLKIHHQYDIELHNKQTKLIQDSMNVKLNGGTNPDKLGKKLETLDATGEI